MFKRKRRKFTEEYNAEVLGLIVSTGKSVAEVAKELDLTDSAVRLWVKQDAVDTKRDPNGPLTSEERAELTRLRRELKTLAQEKAFFKKACALFAGDGKGDSSSSRRRRRHSKRR